MERNYHDLWQGGPWEQPSRPVPPPSRSDRTQRPVLRVKKRRRPLLLLLILTAVVASLALAGHLAHRLIPVPSARIEFPPSVGDLPAFPYEKSDSVRLPSDLYPPPTIPAAETGTGVTITLESGEATSLSYEEIYSRCAPSVVSITNYSHRGKNTGSGIVLTEDGYILTNAHVVSAGSRVEVVTFDNRIGFASLVGFDANEDLAVLKVDLTGLTPARFASSDELRIGQQVAAIGDSLGYRSTITDGIISALDREVEVDGLTMTLVQTSAAINLGSSGGALIDEFGRVVGITAVKIISSDGSAESLGFAIPSTRVKYVADRLIAGETITPGVFGITVNTFPVDGKGLEVLSVSPGSDAEVKGIGPGDILLQANGMDLTSAQLLSRLKNSHGAGDVIVFAVERQGQRFDVEVLLTDPSKLEGY